MEDGMVAMKHYEFTGKRKERDIEPYLVDGWDTVIYHKGCNDGFCAAWLYWRNIKQENRENVRFIPVQYDEPVPDNLGGRRVLMLDFSYKRKEMERMKFYTEDLLVIDHHKSAEEELKGLDFCIFNMNKSGAKLYWDSCFGGNDISPNWLVEYTQDRDLWQWKLPYSREISASLASYPKDFELWNRIYGNGPEPLIPEGRGILRYQQGMIDAKVKVVSFVEIGGYVVPCVNTTTLTSEIVGTIAEEMPEYPFAAGFFILNNGNAQYSLRMRDDAEEAYALDLSKIARRYGGGGHPKSAGFTLQTTLPMFPKGFTQADQAPQ